jgi:hypothetical protein
VQRALSQFEPFQFHPVGANVGKVILRLLHKPAFGAAAKDLGQPYGRASRLRVPIASCA